MEEYRETRGKTSINPDVLITIARLNAISVPGVSRMASGPHGVDNLIKRYYSEGVKIEVENNTVYVDLYLVLYRNVDLRQTSRKVQKKVSRAISEIVGMDIGHINIHIEDIDLAAQE